MRNSHGRGVCSLFGANFARIYSNYTRILLTCLALTLTSTAVWWGCSEDPVAPSGEQRALRYIAEPGLLLGPIDGITTGWHVAPHDFAVPRGAAVQLRCPLPTTAEVRWIGATEIARDGAGSTAECPTVGVGTHDVRVEVVFAPDRRDNDPRKPQVTAVETAVYQCEFEVVDIDARRIRVSRPQITREPLYVSQSASNWELMKHYFSGSIAAVHAVGNGRYVTAVETPVRLAVHVEPPIFAPLAEWRVDGKPVLLGERATYALQNPGQHKVEVGPLGASASLIIDSYRVTTVEATNLADSNIPDGAAVSFVARTEPAGFERFVTWLGATQFGTVSPTTGHGATFTVTFDETVGREAEGNLDRWVGVRADNATFNQDGPATGTIEVAVTDSIGDPYAGVVVRLEFVGMEGTTDASGIVTFNNVPNGSIAITLIETLTVANPGGDPIIINVVADQLINVLVTGGLTSQLDCTFVVDAPQEKPGCGTVPFTLIAMAVRGDGLFAAKLEAGVVGPCPCAANFSGPFPPLGGGCPATVELLLAAKPPAQLWSVVCSTCLGGVGCEQPTATSTSAVFD